MINAEQLWKSQKSKLQYDRIISWVEHAIQTAKNGPFIQARGFTNRFQGLESEAFEKARSHVQRYGYKLVRINSDELMISW